jgi:hypothetical protein
MVKVVPLLEYADRYDVKKLIGAGRELQQMNKVYVPHRTLLLPQSCPLGCSCSVRESFILLCASTCSYGCLPLFLSLSRRLNNTPPVDQVSDVVQKCIFASVAFAKLVEHRINYIDDPVLEVCTGLF